MMKSKSKNMYLHTYHKNDLSQQSFLITGGAGFIGSNIVTYLLNNNAKLVRVLDNLSNGYIENISHFLDMKNFEFIKGDIRDLETCRLAVKDIDYIGHLAALGSVPRSIENPILSNEVNISGFLNVLVAAKESPTLKRLVYAASSSTYGDNTTLPKKEGFEGKPLSPYAVTKAVNEMYADVFSKIYNFHSIGLRYFNIFGPNQNPNNPYAAAIPIFCNAYLEGKSITINGDGETSRDFTFVENAVQANIKAFECSSIDKHEVFNIACGEQTTLNEIVDTLDKIYGSNATRNYIPERLGDVKHSLADISKAKEMLSYEPKVFFKQGLEIVFQWYQQMNN